MDDILELVCEDVCKEYTENVKKYRQKISIADC